MFWGLLLFSAFFFFFLLCSDILDSSDTCWSLVQVRVVLLAEYPLEDLFVHDGDHSHDESHILMDDLGLKRVRAATG